MDFKRNNATIGRQTQVPEQNMQHFMSESLWSGCAMIARLQEQDHKQWGVCTRQYAAVG
jgi:hypothetical protein